MEKELKKTVVVVVLLSILVVGLTLSMAANMLMLYMWVIPAESISTIYTVTSAALGALVFMLVFDLLRNTLLRRFSVYLNENLGEQILLGLFKDRIELKKGESSVAMEDLGKVRAFLQSPVATAFLDALIAPLELVSFFSSAPRWGLWPWSACWSLWGPSSWGATPSAPFCAAPISVSALPTALPRSACATPRRHRPWACSLSSPPVGADCRTGSLSTRPRPAKRPGSTRA
jgi:hypothetical protein